MKLVDVRWDGRTESGEETRAAGDIGSVLILPKTILIVFSFCEIGCVLLGEITPI